MRKLTGTLTRGMRFAGMVLMLTLTAAGCSGATGADGSYELPEGWPVQTFPIPPGSNLAELKASDTEVQLTIFDADAEELLSFFRGALEDEGYNIVDDNQDIGSLDFTGNGISGFILARTITNITLTVD